MEGVEDAPRPRRTETREPSRAARAAAATPAPPRPRRACLGRIGLTYPDASSIAPMMLPLTQREPRSVKGGDGCQTFRVLAASLAPHEVAAAAAAPPASRVIISLELAGARPLLKQSHQKSTPNVHKVRTDQVVHDTSPTV